MFTEYNTVYCIMTQINAGMPNAGKVASPASPHRHSGIKVSGTGTAAGTAGTGTAAHCPALTAKRNHYLVTTCTVL